MFGLFASAYLNVIFFALHIINAGSFPKPLSAEEEAKYLKLAAEGDEKAKNILIERNLRLVAHIIKKYYSNARDQDDLVSIGTIGLIKAVSTFKADKGTRLATYASRCIENEILMYFRNMRKTQGDVYMDDPIETDKEGNALTLSDILACEDNVIDNIDTRMKTEQMLEYLRRLPTRERMILELRYGLGGGKQYAQREIAAMLGISRSYVSRIEKKAMNSLKNMFPDEN